MGFEIFALVPILPERAKTDAEKNMLKTRVAVVRTVGQNFQDHTTAFILMESLDYEIGERCPESMIPTKNDDGDVEYEFEGCGEVLEYTESELREAIARVEASDNEESQKKAVLLFLNKAVSAVVDGEWDKAEIGFF